jgi:hypothetical protein
MAFPDQIDPNLGIGTLLIEAHNRMARRLWHLERAAKAVKGSHRRDQLRPQIILRTSEEWSELIGSMGVVDPDGWDRQNWAYSWSEEKISAGMYVARCNSSTCEYPRTRGEA